MPDAIRSLGSLALTAAGAIGVGILLEWWWLREHVARVIEDQPVPLPHSYAEVPILGFKGANLDWSTGRFVPLLYGHQGRTYGIDAFAECTPGVQKIARDIIDVVHEPRHAAPDEHCRCGFYAFAAGHANQLLTAPLILEVELSGTVIVGEIGWRAEHQRVLAVWLGMCSSCGLRRAVAVTPAMADGGIVTPCEECLTTMRQVGDTPIRRADDLAALLGVPVSEGVPPAA